MKKFMVTVDDAKFEVRKRKRLVLYCTCPDIKKANLIAKALNALESEK